VPKFESWAFQRRSVKPRKYDQSCMRLCIAKRFVTAAEMSLLTPGVKVEVHPFVCHSFVHG
jgi:hypothetical protein